MVMAKLRGRNVSVYTHFFPSMKFTNLFGYMNKREFNLVEAFTAFEKRVSCSAPCEYPTEEDVHLFLEGRRVR